MAKMVKKYVVCAGYYSSRPPVEFEFDVDPPYEKLEVIQELNKADWIEIRERWIVKDKNGGN